jgi:hypothetical protein
MVMQVVLEIGAKAVGGAVLVVLFALLAETLAPKRFAGIFAGAPSVALASLVVTLLAKGTADAGTASAGMIAGAIGFVAAGLVAPPLMRRWGTTKGVASALGIWLVVASIALGVAAASSTSTAAAAAAAFRQQERPRPRLEFKPGKLRQAGAREWWIRAAFGAGVSAVSGIISELAGPLVGGAFLAFPAILLASLTMVREKDGRARARDDARGATMGALGLVGFAVVGAITFPVLAPAIVLVIASVTWAVLALGAYGVAWLAGAGGDEPKAG